MNTKPKVDWTKVPAGTMIHVRDYDGESWYVREFIQYDREYSVPFVCKNSEGNIHPYSYINWTQAELIEDHPEVQSHLVTDVQFEGDNVRIPVTTYLEITASEYGLIQSLYPNNQVSIIKYIREVHKFGLVETKKICDTICVLN